MTTDEYSRRSLQIEGAGSRIEVVLWGEAAVREYAISKKVTFTALIKEERRLSSTTSTSVEVGFAISG